VTKFTKITKHFPTRKGFRASNNKGYTYYQTVMKKVKKDKDTYERNGPFQILPVALAH